MLVPSLAQRTVSLRVLLPDGRLLPPLPDGVSNTAYTAAGKRFLSFSQVFQQLFVHSAEPRPQPDWKPFSPNADDG
jgi:hypothetical protein